MDEDGNPIKIHEAPRGGAREPELITNSSSGASSQIPVYGSPQEYESDKASNPRAEWQLCTYHDECHSGCCVEPRHAFMPISKREYEYTGEDDEWESGSDSDDDDDRRRLQDLVHQ